MSNNVCGNCARFRLSPGDNFFNCTSAKSAGLSYGMQVRPDTRACDVFMANDIDIDIPQQPKQVPRIKEMQAEDTLETENSEPVGLCTLGQKSLVASVSVAIVLVSWLLYTCAQ